MAAAHSYGMSTLTKTKKPAPRVRAVVKAPVKIGNYKFTPRTPPPAKTTAADLFKIKDFGKGLDGALVEQIVADRRR